MVYGRKFIDENFFDFRDISESQRDPVEETVVDLAVDDFIDKLGNRFDSILFQAPGGGFHGIGHHQDRRFAGVGVRSGVGERRFVDRLSGILIFIGIIEIFCFRITSAPQ